MIRYDAEYDFGILEMNRFQWLMVEASVVSVSMSVTGFHRWSVNIGSGNGLVPSGNKPLHEPMLTQTAVGPNDIKRHSTGLHHSRVSAIV